METNVGRIASNRILKRLRYVPNYGWVTSSDTFKGRVQPKFTDAIQRTRQVDEPELFLNTVVFRDNSSFVNSYLGPTYTFPTSGEALISAETGTSIVDGDRILEESTGKMWMIMSIAEYRDSRLKHDEITCIEASQYDLRWIQPIEILSMTDPISGSNYDPIRRQFIKLEESEMTSVQAFGVIENFDVNRFLRDTKLLQRTEVGKEKNDLFQIVMDQDFGVNENNILNLLGKNFKVEFIRSTIQRIDLIGLSEYKQKGMGDDTLNVPTERNIVI